MDRLTLASQNCETEAERPALLFGLQYNDRSYIDSISLLGYTTSYPKRTKTVLNQSYSSVATALAFVRSSVGTNYYPATHHSGTPYNTPLASTITWEIRLQASTLNRQQKKHAKRWELTQDSGWLRRSDTRTVGVKRLTENRDPPLGDEIIPEPVDDDSDVAEKRQGHVEQRSPHRLVLVELLADPLELPGAHEPAADTHEYAHETTERTQIYARALRPESAPFFLFLSWRWQDGTNRAQSVEAKKGKQLAGR